MKDEIKAISDSKVTSAVDVAALFIDAMVQLRNVMEPYLMGYEVDQHDLFERVMEVFDYLGMEVKDRAWSDEEVKTIMGEKWHEL